jgi:hypothetical protein
MNWLPADNPTPVLLVRPRGAVSLDEANQAIELWEHYSRKRLDQAQRVAVELMMAESASGRWAARTTGRAMARQNGKGDEVEVVEAWCLLQRAEAILHTAHEIPTAKRAHMRLVAFFESHADLRRKIGRPRYGNGNYAIPLLNGAIIDYRTRTLGGGRGLDDISRLVIDEAQHAQPEQLASSTPILAANPNPQTNYTGTAGIAGKSDWWWSLRRRALSGDDLGFAWLEHSAEMIELVDGRVVVTPPEPTDHDAWWRANPALGARLEVEFLHEQLKTLGPDLFAREHLCVWDPCEDEDRGVLDLDLWQSLADPTSAIASHHCLALDVAFDRKWASFAAAGRRADGKAHVEVFHRQPGTNWVVERAVEAHTKSGLPVRILSGSPAASFVPLLMERGVAVDEVPPGDHARAVGQFLDAVENRELAHLGDPMLTAALSGAVLRSSSNDSSVWARKSSKVDISPLVAVTVALGGVPTLVDVVNVYEERGMRTIG